MPSDDDGPAARRPAGPPPEPGDAASPPDPEAQEWAPARGRDPGNPFATAAWAQLSLAGLMAAVGPPGAPGLVVSLLLMAGPVVVLLWWLTLLGGRGPRRVTAWLGPPLAVGMAVAGFPLLAGEAVAGVAGLAAGALSAVVAVVATRADEVPRLRRGVRRVVPAAVGALLAARLLVTTLAGG